MKYAVLTVTTESSLGNSFPSYDTSKSFDKYEDAQELLERKYEDMLESYEYEDLEENYIEEDKDCAYIEYIGKSMSESSYAYEYRIINVN